MLLMPLMRMTRGFWMAEGRKQTLLGMTTGLR